jgi:hypothetical protein
MTMVTTQLTQGTQLSRYQAYQLAVGGPWMTAAEARDAENLPPQEPMPNAPDDESQRPLEAVNAGPSAAQVSATAGSQP